PRPLETRGCDGGARRRKNHRAVGEEAPTETLTHLSLRGASLFQLFSLLFFVMERVVYKTPVSFMFGASASFALYDFVHTKHISCHELNAPTNPLRGVARASEPYAPDQHLI